MTNSQFGSIKIYRDIEALNYCRDADTQGITPEEAIAYIEACCRDHSRTPTQWKREATAGLTAGIPWTLVNLNFGEIQIDRQIRVHDSVLQYYCRIIYQHKETGIYVLGDFPATLEDSCESGSYVQILNGIEYTEVCSFTNHILPLPIDLANEEWYLALCNQLDHEKVSFSDMKLSC